MLAHCPVDWVSFTAYSIHFKGPLHITVRGGSDRSGNGGDADAGASAKVVGLQEWGCNSQYAGPVVLCGTATGSGTGFCARAASGVRPAGRRTEGRYPRFPRYRAIRAGAQLALNRTYSTTVWIVVAGLPTHSPSVL